MPSVLITRGEDAGAGSNVRKLPVAPLFPQFSQPGRPWSHYSGQRLYRDVTLEADVPGLVCKLGGSSFSLCVVPSVSAKSPCLGDICAFLETEAGVGPARCTVTSLDPSLLALCAAQF